MKSKLMIGLVICCLVVVIFFVFFREERHYEGKFYLEDEYYQVSGFQSISVRDFKKLGNKSYVLFIYNDYCSFPVPCERIFEEFMNEYHVSFLSMSLNFHI